MSQLATRPIIPTPKYITYDKYLTESEIGRRSEIVLGERIFMPSPTWLHQQIVIALILCLNNYKQRRKDGFVGVAPFDLVIRRAPLLIRQPDVFFISGERLAKSGGAPAKGGLEIGPELVIEIVLDSETRSSIMEKLTDYRSIGVEECWIVQPISKSVEVLRLTADSAGTLGVYTIEETVSSAIFADLSVAVHDLFPK